MSLLSIDGINVFSTPLELSTPWFFSNFALPATLEDQQSSKKMSNFTSQTDTLPWEAFWVPVTLLSISFSFEYEFLLRVRHLATSQKECIFLYRVSEMTSPRGVPLSLGFTKRYPYLSPTPFISQLLQRERHTLPGGTAGYPAQTGLPWRNPSRWPAQPGLTWRNPSGWPAQPGLTWRNQFLLVTQPI